MERETMTPNPIIIDVKERGLDRPLLRGKRLILLDTPGLDNADGHGAVILQRIATWLARS